MKSQASPIAQCTRAAYDALDARQKVFFETIFAYECEQAVMYRHFEMRDAPRAKNSEWRWLRHREGYGLYTKLQERAVTSDFEATYEELVEAGLIEYQTAYLFGGGSAVRITSQGKELGFSLWPDIPGASRKTHYGRYPTLRELITAHVKEPNGPTSFYRWLADKVERNFAFSLDQKQIPETGEQGWFCDILESWLNDEATRGSRYLFIGFSTWSFVVGKRLREVAFPDWIIRFQRGLSDLFSWPGIPVTNSVRTETALIALWMATAKGVSANAFFIPADRLAMIDFAVLGGSDTQIHALYPNQYKTYTVCDTYLKRDEVRGRGRCRTLSAFMLLSNLSEPWRGKISVCPVCKARVRQQIAAGARAERTFMEMSQLEDARLPVDVDADGLLRASSE